MEKPTIVVAGATGAQGGSVVEFLLRDGKFNVRGLTRNVNADKAKALAARGVQMVSAELKDKQALAGALKGAAGFFLVTQFWEKFSEEDEYQQAITAIEAAAEAKVGHLVFSTLPGARALTENKVHCAHLDSKWRAVAALQKSGLSHTLLFVPFYFQNWATFFPPRPNQEGKLAFTTAGAGNAWPQVDVEDVGSVVVPLFHDPKKYNGKLVDLFAAEYSTAEVAVAYNKVHGTAAVASDVPPDVFAKFGFPGAEELADMFKIFIQVHEARAKDPKNAYAGLGIKAEDYIAGGSQIAVSPLRTIDQFFANKKQ